MKAFKVMYISKRNDEYDTKGNQAPFDSEGSEKAEVAAYAMVSTGKDAMLHSLASQVKAYRSRIQANQHENSRGSTLTKSSPARRRRGRDCRG